LFCFSSLYVANVPVSLNYWMHLRCSWTCINYYMMSDTRWWPRVGQWFDPANLYCSVCAKPGNWTVMYLCARIINVASYYKKLKFDCGTVQAM
jgi:hypothetical protein